MSSPKIAVYSLSGAYLVSACPTTAVLIKPRSQKHNRRRPPQLPHLPEIPPIPLPNRHPTSPRLQRRRHRRNNILRRLETRLGQDEIWDILGRIGIFRTQWRVNVLDMGSREGDGICRGYRASECGEEYGMCCFFWGKREGRR